MGCLVSGLSFFFFFCHAKRSNALRVAGIASTAKKKTAKSLTWPNYLVIFFSKAIPKWSCAIAVDDMTILVLLLFFFFLYAIFFFPPKYYCTISLSLSLSVQFQNSTIFPPSSLSDLILPEKIFFLFFFLSVSLFIFPTTHRPHIFPIILLFVLLAQTIKRNNSLKAKT